MGCRDGGNRRDKHSWSARRRTIDLFRQGRARQGIQIAQRSDHPVHSDRRNTMILRRISWTITQHPAATFFILAFAFTWANWVPQALASRGLPTVQVPGVVTMVAGYGPALAAGLVSPQLSCQPGLRT